MICPHCGTEKDGRGIKRHVVACARNPGKSTLIEMCERGLTVAQIARIRCVSPATVKQWLERYGLRRASVKDMVRPARKVSVIAQPPAVHGKTGNCGRCYRAWLCGLTVHLLARVACEGMLERELQP